MQTSQQAVVTTKTTTPAPVALTPEQLKQVAGGVSPNSSW